MQIEQLTFKPGEVVEINDDLQARSDIPHVWLVAQVMEPVSSVIPVPLKVNEFYWAMWRMNVKRVELAEYSGPGGQFQGKFLVKMFF